MELEMPEKTQLNSVRDIKHHSPTRCIAADIQHHCFFIQEVCMVYVTFI